MADFSLVTARLATGAALESADDIDALLGAGFTHVIDCRIEFDDAQLLASSGMAYLWDGTADDGTPKGPEWFQPGIEFALAALARPHAKVYAHCVPSGMLIGAPVPARIEHATEATGHDGVVHKVTEHMSRYYVGDLAVIESTGALPLRLTPEHPVLVARPYRWPNGSAAKPATPSWRNVTTYTEHYRTQPQWTDAGDVQPGDYLVAPLPRQYGDPTEVRWPERAANSKTLQPLWPCDDHAWMLGLYAADGSTNGQNGINFVLSSREHVARLCRIWRNLGAAPFLEEQPGYTRVVIPSRSAAEAMGGWSGKRDAKRLPGFVFDGWPLGSLLDGYAAGDGHLDKRGRMTTTTISPVLAEQVRAALLMTGESPTVSLLKRYSGFPNARPGYAIRWSPAATQRHTAWWRGSYLMPVTAVTAEPYDGLVHNLEVADAHTYTVGGATVHNCAAGVNRGPSMAYAVLRAQGWPAGLAEAQIRQARPMAGLAYKDDADRAVAALGYT